MSGKDNPMSNPTEWRDQVEQQYASAANLNARIQLHARFSANPYPLWQWFFDQLELPASARLLEVGAGTGELWRVNAGRIPPGWDITVSDLMPGMLDSARASLAGLPARFSFRVIDAQAIPCDNACFDAVIANYMLPFVPDRASALAEIQRVLKPGGWLYAMLNGRGHLRQLTELVRAFDPVSDLDFGALPLCLEDAPAELAPWFSAVTVTPYDDALLITESAPLVAYVRSAMSSAHSRALTDASENDFRRFVEAEIQAKGGTIRVDKVTGLITARR
jgi:ubiquinone/menaquinone biosynthesis C-methylase UbiE